MDISNVLFAFGVTLFAGLATGIGSLMALVSKRTNTRFLAGALGFSAGVMIYISFMDILPEAKRVIISVLGEGNGSLVAIGGFFFGMIALAIIDRLVPERENPHELRKVEDMEKAPEGTPDLMRVGFFTAIALAIHNFPEGFATFMVAIRDPHIAIPIAFAIAIHNIPEGIAVSVPVYYATGDKKKAFKYSFLSGLAEPLGAIIGYTVLYRFLNEVVFGFILAAVAGTMIYISLDELLPSARSYGEGHLAIYGVMAGMAVIAVSLLLFL